MAALRLADPDGFVAVNALDLTIAADIEALLGHYNPQTAVSASLIDGFQSAPSCPAPSPPP